MATESNAIASATVELLEERLRRLTYLLTGYTNWAGEPTTPAKPEHLEDTISRRLVRLEKELEKLSKKVPAVREVIQLRELPLPLALSFLSNVGCISRKLINQLRNQPKDDRHPDLIGSPTSADSIPADLTIQNLASIVLSYASAFPETSSRLTSLNDLPIPDARTSASLIELQPRLNELAQRQDEQNRAISELRVRTARVLQRWYEIGLVGNGECWAEWEGRLEDVEREVRREEVVRERRGNNVV